jgi:methylthioribose-1-phosphate isomerase
MKPSTIESHPHNATASTYEKAIAAAAELNLNAQKFDEVVCEMTFETIEASDARRDAIELFKAVQAVRDAIDAARDVAKVTQANARTRAHYLANGSGL